MTSLLYHFYFYECAASQVDHGSIIALAWAEAMKAAVTLTAFSWCMVLAG
jgi:hypothetical protein